MATKPTSLKRESEDRDLAHELDVIYFERFVKALPSRERAKKRFFIGSRVFSVRELLEEMRRKTVYGEFIRDAFRAARLKGMRGHKP